MRILHISDTHGLPIEPPDEPFDVVVHSGDLMPNASFGVRAIERRFQPQWLEERLSNLPPRYRDQPMLLCPGNHDFVDPTPALRKAGVDARLLIGALEVGGVRFWGHPWTPTFYDWNYMCEPDAMEEHLAPVAERMARGEIDVLVSHGPMRGVLDRNQSGERCGCPVLRRVLEAASRRPRLVLCGHIHESAGEMQWKDVTVSNAACTQRILTLS